MTKQTQAKHMNTKFVRKFWQFTLLFFLALIVFNKLLFKLYEGIYKTLLLNDIGVFLILAVLFTGLFWELIGQIKDNKQVSWKLRDAFIVAAVIKSIWLIVYAFITLSFVPLSYLKFLDYSIYQWVNSNTFKNIHLIITFVYCSGIYLALKYYYWDTKAKQITSVKRNKKENFELNDDRTLGETEAFQNCTTLEELKEQDKLGRFDYAQQISHIIINNGEKKSFAIGINGDWGSGKTSFIDMIKRINQIDYPEQCIFINFNPWYFTGTEKVLKKFYDTLINTVGNSFSITFRNDLSKYFELICATETKIWKTNFLQYFKKNTDFQSQLNDLKEHFKGLPQKIVIIIDDLDRLQKDETLVLFRTIRLIADFPNVVYLVGYSPNYVDHILEEKESEDEPRFMEKIFQLEFELPEPLVNHLMEFISTNLEEYIPEKQSWIRKGISEIIIDNELLPTLRDVKRFFNQIKINTSLPEIKNNTYIPQFILLELVLYTDVQGYYNLKRANKLEYPKEAKQSTKNIIEWMKELKSQSNLSITNPYHRNKYFFKRLDRKEDLDIQNVASLFNHSNYEDKIEEYYDDNRKVKLIDNFNEFIKGRLIHKESIDKSLATTYLDRTLFLLEHSFKTEGLIDQYFEQRDGFIGIKLLSSIVNIWNKIVYENSDFLKIYFTSKNDLCSYSYLIKNLFEDKNRNEIYFDFNSLFIQRIENQCNKSDFTSLLIDLFNYQLFWKLPNNKFKEESHWVNNKEINQAILKDSQYIFTEITKITSNNRSDEVLNFFGDSRVLLKIYDMKSEGIRNMLDSIHCHYTIGTKSNVNEFSYTINHSHHNFQLNIPSSIREMEILDMNNHCIYNIQKSDDNFIIKSMIETYIEDSLILNDNTVIEFIYEGNSSFLRFRENFQKSSDSYSGDYTINKDKRALYKIHCYTDSKEDFILKRQVILYRGVKDMHLTPFSKS